MTIAPRTKLALAALLLALAACGPVPKDSAFYNRGGPESLLDVSSEVVNLSVAGPNELAELKNWVQSDVPTRAELYCVEGDMQCNAVRQVLDRAGVPTMNVPSNQYSVALVYERILARDCNSRFVDNHRNPYNTPHPSFGCANAANIVQHVSDKQQFVNPNITDTPNATGAVQAYGRAYTPRAASADTYSIDKSLTAGAKSE